MKNIVKRIGTLTKQELNVFMSIVIDEDDGIHLYHFLKGLDSDDRTELMRYFSEEIVVFLEAQLLDRPNPDKTTVSEAATSLNKVLDNLKATITQLEVINSEHRSVIEMHRNFMKECISGELGLTDQAKGLPVPPPQKETGPEAELINLPVTDQMQLDKPNILQCIAERESRRKYTNAALTLEELGYLLWSTQGVRKIFRQGTMTLRTVPSGGARHPFETYLAVNNVTGLRPGVYRYLPLDHTLVHLFADNEMQHKLSHGSLDQTFVGNAAVVFIWSVIPYRGEWRYTISSHKIMLLDVGHVCQNLYLACESLGIGTCAIAAYSQKLMDAFLHLDGHDEFVVYLAPVGRVT